MLNRGTIMNFLI